MAFIASVSSRVISDSRGESTVEVTMTDDQGRLATASLPLGSSIGKYEAGSVKASQAVASITDLLAPALLRRPLTSQRDLDVWLQEFARDKQIKGVNTTLGVSLAAVRLLAQSQGVPLYRYLQTIAASPGFTLPTPMFNLINGGKHGHNNLDFQEYLVIPVGMKTFWEKLAAGRKIFASLGEILRQKGHDAPIGFEGGYAPNLTTNEEGFGFLVEAIKTAGFVPGKDVVLGADIAASSLPSGSTPAISDYEALMRNFPLYALEDPFGEDAWDDWIALRASLEKTRGDTQRFLLIGDDLFVANQQRLQAGIKKAAATAILIKMNQAGTLSEILDCINLARQADYTHILSHRSGETLDVFVSDLAVGTAAPFIKSGAPSDQAPERIVKYERLVEIEEELNVVGKV